MDTTKTVNQTSSLEKLPLSNKPTLIITEKLKRQIDWLHNKCGSIEWSGELITSEINTINDLDNWTIICEDIYLVDIGTSGYTSYEVDKGGFKSADIVDLYDTYPGLIDGTQKNHHIHTHHSMGAFFSGTDWSQLEDRGVLSNYLLMLIVNFKGDYCAKVAFKAKKSGNDDINLNFANNLDGREPLLLKGNPSAEVLVVMDCNIKFEKQELEVDKSFSDRYDTIKKAVEDEKAAFRKPAMLGAGGGYNSPSGWHKNPWKQSELGYDWGGTNDDYFENKKDEGKKKKSVMEMTDEEWTKYQALDGAPVSPEDCNYLLNTYLTNHYGALSYESPLESLIDKNKKLKTKDDLEEFLMEFHHNGFRSHFESIQLQGTASQFIGVLTTLKSTLVKSKYNRLVSELVLELELMIEEEIEDQMDDATFKKTWLFD